MTKKTGITQIAIGRSDVYRLDPDDIHIVDGFNARNFEDPANMEHVEELSLSIAEVGVLQPLRVRMNNGLVELVDGECRLRAARLARSRGADLKSVPVVTEHRYASAADLVLTQLTANSGKNFTPLEKAAVMKRLLAFGWSETEIARKVGISRVRVTQLLELSAAPIEVTQMVGEGKISATLALEAIKEAKGDDQKAVETLQAGIAQAERSGKTRATKKDILAQASAGTKVPSMKAQRDRLLELLKAALDDNPDRDWIKGQFARLCSEAGIGVSSDEEGDHTESEVVEGVFAHGMAGTETQLHDLPAKAQAPST